MFFNSLTFFTLITTAYVALYIHIFQGTVVQIHFLFYICLCRLSYIHLVVLFFPGNSHSGVDLLGGDLGGLQVDHLHYVCRTRRAFYRNI